MSPDERHDWGPLVGGAIAVGLLLSAAPVKAHHAFAAAFDDHKPINLQGTVTKVELVNPHSWLWLDVKGKDGTVTNWGIESGAPNGLISLRHPTQVSVASLIPSGFQLARELTYGSMRISYSA